MSYIQAFKEAMQRKKVEVDVILDVLDATLAAQPHSVFLKSLRQQYLERGGLSKKQLQGLQAKASRVDTIPPARLATLEAEILKRPTRYRSEKPAIQPLYTPDEKTGKMIDAILEKYPAHKRVLFFQSRFRNNEVLSAAEMAELEKFHKLLL
ncbi:MAG: hypothetical protein ACXVBR_14115 [Flavisolibacter sp.]